MGPAYWVLYASHKIQEIMKGLHTQLQDSTLKNSLDIGTMIEDFGADPSNDVDPFSVIAACLTVAAGFAAPAATIAGPITVAVGAFSLASNYGTGDPPDLEASLDSQLGQVFDNARDQLQLTLSGIFGGSYGEFNTNDLPMQTGVYREALARFYADGKFLIQDVSGSMKTVYDEYTSRQVSTLNPNLTNLFIINRNV
jgi:hypothetical protein